MSKLFKSRHLPHRLFTKLLYDSKMASVSSFIVTRQVNLPETAKSLRCSNTRITEALDFLSAFGFVTYHVENKIAFITITLPEDVYEKS